MIVITLTDCPMALRGDLTKWLLEINVGVFVGKVSARVRENLWERVKKYAKGGRATLVFRAANEQGLDFKTHNSEWEPIDFDGVKLIMRPSPARIKHLSKVRKPGFSKASRYLMARHAPSRRVAGDAASPQTYAVVDVETTGLTPGKSEIFEIGALRVVDGEVSDTFVAVVRIDGSIPQKIMELTGVTDEMVKAVGEDLRDVMPRLRNFIGELPIVAHNAAFDISFLNAACKRCGLGIIENELADTLAMARNTVTGVGGYSLKALAEHFGFKTAPPHRGLADCFTTQMLYEKLIKLRAAAKAKV